MVDNRKISLCIPNYNRIDLLLESFSKVYDDQRISEIIVSDDHSERETFEILEKHFEYLPKVKHFRNEVNVDCYRNKKITIELATNEFCILLDSDNVIYKDYLDRIFWIPEWDEKTIYTPDFAKPHFNFKDYSGLTIEKSNVAEYINKPLFETMLNAANYFVNKNEYLKVWDGNTDPVTSDSIFQCYNWLKEGNKIYVVPELEYFHRVHNGSHYQNEKNRTPEGFHQSILNRLKTMA